MMAKQLTFVGVVDLVRVFWFLCIAVSVNATRIVMI